MIRHRSRLFGFVLIVSACGGSSAAPSATGTNSSASSTVRESDQPATSAETGPTVVMDRGLPSGTPVDTGAPTSNQYEAAVQLGNETTLNGAQKSFATYLTGMHRKIHPLFTDVLDADQKSANVFADNKLVTHVEIVVDPSNGKIVRMGITKSSGSTLYDATTLDILDRASPFGKAPDDIVSPDGNVYVHGSFIATPSTLAPSSTREVSCLRIRQS